MRYHIISIREWIIIIETLNVSIYRHIHRERIIISAHYRFSPIQKSQERISQRWNRESLDWPISISHRPLLHNKCEYASNNLLLAKTRNKTMLRLVIMLIISYAARTSERRQSVALCSSKGKCQDQLRSGNSWRWPCGRRKIVFRDNTGGAVLVARGTVKSGDRSGKCLGNASSFPLRKTRHRNEWRGKSEILRCGSSKYIRRWVRLSLCGAHSANQIW